MHACSEAVAAGLMAAHPFPDFVPGDMSDANYAHIDLHKHVVDGIVLKAADGRPMHRESDLIDVWFDSGSMPYAQWHYPFENKERVEGATGGNAYPADFIAEGVDQTRGWFYTLHAISTMVFDKVAYKAVVSNGLVLDKEGQKMSKRLGNAADPFETLEKFGSRCHAVVHDHQCPALGQPAFRHGGHCRGAAQVLWHAAQHLRVFRPLCGHRWVCAGFGGAVGGRSARIGPLDPQQTEHLHCRSRSRF